MALLVQTTHLNSFVNPDAEIYVALGDTWVRKRAQDLHEGDVIRVHADYVDKDKEEVFPLLDQHSLRYRLAKRQLFEENERGEEVPRLRCLLLRGAAQRFPSLQSDDLEDRIFGNNGAEDFTRRELAPAIDYLVDNVGLEIGKETVYNWFRGETVAPKDWFAFTKLEEAFTGSVEAEFAAIGNSHGALLGFHNAYRLYTGLRRTVMASLARRTSETRRPRSIEGPSSSSSNASSGTYSREIAAVVKTLIGDVERDEATARITSINTVKKPINPPFPRSPSRAKSGLSKGLLVGSTPSCVVDMNQVFTLYYLLEQAFYDIVNFYNIDHFPTGSDPAETLAFGCFAPYVSKQLNPFDFAMATMSDSALASHTDTAIDLEGAVRSRYNVFLDALAQGLIDAPSSGRYILRLGTAVTLIDTYRSYSAAMPAAWYERRQLDYRCQNVEHSLSQDGLGRKARRRIEHKVDKLKLKIKRRHDYITKEYGSLHRPDLFMDYHSKQNITFQNREMQRIAEIGDRHLREYEMSVLQQEYRRRVYDVDCLRQAKRQYQEDGRVFFTEDQARRHLRSVGLGSVIAVYAEHSFI